MEAKHYGNGRTARTILSTLREITREEYTTSANGVPSLNEATNLSTTMNGAKRKSTFL